VDHATPLEEMLRALDDLVRQGKVPLYRLLELRNLAPDGGAVISDTKGLGALRLLPAAITA